MAPDFNLNSPNSLTATLTSGPSSFNKQHHPATFVTKLYLMVDDSSTNAYIRWGPEGDSFIVSYPEEFAREILPRFFKHNNFSSFVRQLNMYGFHKVPHITTATPMLSAFDGCGDGGDYFSRALSIQSTSSFTNASFPSYTNAWEFSHENFRRNQTNLLLNVRRKIQHQTCNNSHSGITATPTTQNAKPSHQESTSTNLTPLHNGSNSHAPSFYNIFSNPDFSNRILEYLTYNATAATSASTNTVNPTNQSQQSAILPLAIGAAPLKEHHHISTDNQFSAADLSIVLSELSAIKLQQKQVLEKLSHLEIDQSMLWRDSMKCRERCNSQQELIEKILRFLASVFTSGDKKLKDGIASLFHTLHHLQPSISSSIDGKRDPDKLPSASELNNYYEEDTEGNDELDINNHDSLSNNQALFSNQWQHTTESNISSQKNFFSSHPHHTSHYNKRQKLITNIRNNNSNNKSTIEVFTDRSSPITTNIQPSTTTNVPSSVSTTTNIHQYSPYLQHHESEITDLDNLEDVGNALGPEFDLASFLNTEIAYSEDS